ncbi:uncharacterized protein ZBIST_1257 [Zygosaccharomyces bailii]|nr:uncharacterized protein ZBIST_1257 [Zygosaccharomyces bailii]
MKSITRIAVFKNSGLRFQSSNSNGGHLMRRLQDLKDQSTVDTNDPLVKITQLNESDFVNDWATEEDKLNADKVLEIIDAQKQAAKTNQGISSLKSEENGSDTASQAQREAIQYINKMPGITFREKLETAQNRAIRYKLRQGKINQAKDDNEQLHFKELYGERFTPIGSFEKLESLADRRIEESMKQGGFKDLEKVRGKPTKLPKPNPYLSTTEHYLNNILVKQNIVPPWIENQSRVNQNVTELRSDLLRGFEGELATFLRKFKLVNASSDLKLVSSSIASSYGSVEEFIQYRFDNWKLKQKPTVDTRIDVINSALRTYNLQAPLPAQKLYLLPEKEFQRVRDEANLRRVVDEEVQNLKHRQYEAKQNVETTILSFRGLFKFW